jgi:hypothetical protein
LPSGIRSKPIPPYAHPPVADAAAVAGEEVKNIRARSDAIAHAIVPEDGNYRGNGQYKREWRIARDAARTAFEEIAAHPAPAERCYTVEGDHAAREKALAKWVREAMRFIDLCDADAGGYDDLHSHAERLTVEGYFLFGADAVFDKWCLADLEHRSLTAFLDRDPAPAEPTSLDQHLARRLAKASSIIRRWVEQESVMTDPDCANPILREAERFLADKGLAPADPVGLREAAITEAFEDGWIAALTRTDEASTDGEGV